MSGPASGDGILSRPTLQYLHLDWLRLVLLPGYQEQGSEKPVPKEEFLNALEERQTERGVLGKEAANISNHGIHW